MKKSIIYITHYSEYMGANRSLFQIIKGVSKQNYNPIVILPNKGIFTELLDKNHIRYEIIKFYSPLYIKDKWYNNIYLSVKGLIKEFFNILIAIKISRKFQNQKINLIHTNTSVTNLGAYISFFMKTPHIWHIREFAYLHYGFLHPWGDKIQRFLMNKLSNSVVTVSKCLEKYYEKDIDKEKLYTIYNGLDIDSQEKLINKDNEVINLITVGLIHPSKGQKEVIISFIKCKQLHRNIKIHLYIVGDYSDKTYYQELIDIVYLNKMENDITFTGYLDDINNLLDKMHIGILASSNEAFGRVTIEYMLHKLVPIVKNSGASTELIKNNKTGYLYNENKELTTIITKLIENPYIRNFISENAYIYARNNFNINLTINEIISLYKKLK